MTGKDQKSQTGRIRVSEATTAEEKERLYRFRYEIYVDELGKSGVSAADHDNRMLVDDYDLDARQYYVETGDNLTACLRILMTGSRDGDSAMPKVLEDLYHVRPFLDFSPRARISFTSRLMVAAGQRGSAALHLMLSQAYEVALDQGVLFDFCHCSPALVELYEHLGYRRYAPNFTDPDVGYRVPLVLLLRDADHLRAIRSPFWRKLRERPNLWHSETVGAWLRAEFPMSATISEWLLDEESFWEFLANKLLPVPRQDIPFLDGLSDDETKKVLRSGTVLSAQSNDTIIRAGEVGNELFVILSGLVEVRAAQGGRPIAVFEPGQVFGEIAFISNTTRSADVVALDDTEILVVTQGWLKKMMLGSPELASKVLLNLSRILCERLVVSTRTWVGSENLSSAYANEDPLPFQ